MFKLSFFSGFKKILFGEFALNFNYFYQKIWS